MRGNRCLLRWQAPGRDSTQAVRLTVGPLPGRSVLCLKLRHALLQERRTDSI